LSPGQAEFELQAKHPAREVDQERAGCKLINFKQGVGYFWKVVLLERKTKRINLTTAQCY